ncbi:MAG TPA: ornithine cyclodeaminase family protein, partial [Calditrichia bacterium]|nr:ornithine cyclodeaminase family protein [Calditrichia bacterium]
LKPWLHINAAGADFPGKVEVPLTVLHRAFVCPDFPGQALKEGECQRLAPEEIGAPLEEVIKSPGDFREFREKTTVFDSTGWALEDMVTLDLLIECANDLGIGTPLNIESLSEDPKNPYGFLGDLGSETPAGTGKVRETARV